MTEPTLTFYWGSGSPYAWRAMLGLALKGLAFESKLLQFSTGEQRSPAMLALNPRGKVPVLVHGEVVVYESLAILAYLERAFPSPPLFGATAAEAGQVWRMVAEHDAYVLPLGPRLVRPLFIGKVEAIQEGAEEIRAAAAEVRAELGRVEEALADRPWVAGPTVSAADIVHWVSLQQFLRAAAKPLAEPLELGLLPFEAQHPRLAAWSDRFRALPGVESTWPPHWG